MLVTSRDRSRGWSHAYQAQVAGAGATHTKRNAADKVLITNQVFPYASGPVIDASWATNQCSGDVNEMDF
jgi:hypothetical protein